jgi:hypothetical protein
MVNRLPSEEPAFRIIRQEVAPEQIAAAGFGEIAANLGDPGLVERLANVHNSMQEMIAKGMADILTKKMRGEMTDKEYEFLTTVYPDLPR